MIFYESGMKEMPVDWKECKAFRKICRVEHLCIERYEAGLERPVICPLRIFPNREEAHKILVEAQSRDSNTSVGELLDRLGFIKELTK